MIKMEIFESAQRSAGDCAGVFEYAHGAGYLYLYDMSRPEQQKVVAEVRVFVGAPDFDKDEVRVSWDTTETVVGLFIRGVLWAANDLKDGRKYAGGYLSGQRPAGLIGLEAKYEFKTQN